MRIPPTIDRWFFLFPLALFLSTCADRMGLPDSVIIVEEMAMPVINSHVNCHSLNNLLGWLCIQLPGANVIWKANLSSVIAMTVAMGLFHRVLLAMGITRPIAALTGGVMTVSHSVWWHGTQADSYALSAAFFCGLFLLSLRGLRNDAPSRRRLALICFLAGLSVFNHLQNGALCLGAAAFVLSRTRRPSTLMYCALAGLAGLLPYGFVLIRDLFVTADRAATAAWAAGGGFRALMFQYDVWSAARLFGHWLLLQFPSPVLALIPAGLWAVARRPQRCRLFVFPFTVFLITAAFFAGYQTWDQFAFYLPCFLVLGWLAGQGAQHFAERAAFRPWVMTALVAGLVMPPLCYPRIPGWSSSGTGYWNARYAETRNVYRDRYDLVGLYTDPIRRDRGTVEHFARDLLLRLPPRAWLIDDVSIFYQLQYLRQQEAARPDLRVLLLQPLGMADWGQPVSEVVNLGTLAPGRLFIVATNGPCALAIEGFATRGRRPVAYALSHDRLIYELIRDGYPATVPPSNPVP